MLEALRKGAGSLVAKIFIFLLVASFAVWGVADIFRTRPGTSVAEVGGTEVSVEAFRQALRQEIQSLSQRTGTYLTMDQARQMGLDSRVLGRLMAEAALSDEAARRNLRVPDEVVADSVRKEQAFQGADGNFDRNRFQQYLRSTGYSEGAFVAEQRQRLLRRAIAQAVGGEPASPTTLAAAFDRYINETRSADYVMVTPDQVKDVAQPSEDDLKKYYDEHKAEFTAPEYRTVGLLTATPSQIAQSIDVSQADLEQAYNARKSEFTKPEKRTIEQISFNSMEDAQAAYKKIQDGESFEDAAKARGMSQSDIELGTMTKDEVVDPTVADAAFSLKQGEVSEPVKGQFAPVILRVTNVQPGSEPSLQDVAPQLREGIATERARNDILDIYDKVEDDRASGMTLQEIAKKRGLNFEQVTLDQAGQSKDGEKVALPQANELLSGIFESDVGIETDALQTDDEGYVWYAVNDISPSRQLSLEEAHDAVAQAWSRDQMDERVRARTDELVAELKKGKSLQDVAGEIGSPVLSVGPVKRTQDTGEFGQAALGLMFTTKSGEIADTTAADPASRVIFRVTNVSVPEFKPNPDGPVQQQLQSSITNDLLDQYLKGLEDDLGSSVNQQVLGRALGETAG